MTVLSRYFGIRSRLWLAATLPALLAIVLLLQGFLVHHDRALTEALRERAQATARQLAVAAEFPLFSGNREQLQLLVDGARAADDQIAAILILTPDGHPVVAAGQSAATPQPMADPVAEGDYLLATAPILSALLIDQDLYSEASAGTARSSEALRGQVQVELKLDAVRRQRERLLDWVWLAMGGGLLLAVLLSVWIASSVTGPIVRIGRAVERLSGGDLRARVDARRTGVLRVLAEGVNEMADSMAMSQDELHRRVREATEALRQQKEAAEQLARIDPLTGLLNRRAFFEASEVEIRRVLRYRQPLSVIAIDLDHFKSINDSYGHGAGDSVLIDFAHVVSQQLRGVDLVARLGGEEFVVLLPDSDTQGALRVAERLRLALADSGPQVGEGVLHYTASFGVAGLDPGQSSLEELLERADTALYAAKRQGRNRVELAPATSGRAA